MYVGEKSDEVVVPRKRPNKGKATSGGDVEGRASPEGTADRRPWWALSNERPYRDPPEKRG
jgi:hypothetical protein